MTNEDLIKQIEDHCSAVKMSVTSFGKYAVNDGKLVDRLRRGNTIELLTLNKITSFIASSKKAVEAECGADLGDGRGVH